MRILTDVSKAELDYLTSQPTADEAKRQQIEAELNQVNAELLLKTTESYRREHSSVY